MWLNVTEAGKYVWSNELFCLSSFFRHIKYVVSYNYTTNWKLNTKKAENSTELKITFPVSHMMDRHGNGLVTSDRKKYMK